MDDVEVGVARQGIKAPSTSCLGRLRYRGKEVLALLRAHPVVWIVPLCKLLVLCALGITLVMVAKRHHIRSERGVAQSFARDAATTMR